jgi:hypothetical protein
MSKRGQRRGKTLARMRRERSNFESGGDPVLEDDPQIPEIKDAKSTRTRDDNFSLFHYTTASGLIGIIQSKTLWATHAKFLNDTAECQLLSALLTPQVETEFLDIVPRLTDVGAFRPEIMQTLGSQLTTEAERVTSAILETIERVSPIHVTSFCRHQVAAPECDHGLLSQWRGYAAGGFAIEFDESMLDDLIDVESTTFSYQGMISRKVEYENHKDAAELSQFKGIGAAFLKVAIKDAAPNLSERPEVLNILGKSELSSYIRAFMNALPFLKSARFKEENEYRVVALPTRSAQAIDEIGDQRLHKEMHFREGSAGMLVPFIKLFEKNEQGLPIKKIIVGPHRDQQNQVRATELLLERHNVKAPVVASETTLRW